MRNQLENEQEEEIGVGEALKLFEQIFRQKCDYVVFRCGHRVVLK